MSAEERTREKKKNQKKSPWSRTNLAKLSRRVGTAKGKGQTCLFRKPLEIFPRQFRLVFVHDVLNVWEELLERQT